MRNQTKQSLKVSFYNKMTNTIVAAIAIKTYMKNISKLEHSKSLSETLVKLTPLLKNCLQFQTCTKIPKTKAMVYMILYLFV